VDSAWIQDNIQIDRTIPFGSEEYFTLAQDPEARPHLQSGTNVIFGYQGQVIAIEDGGKESTPGQGVSGQQPTPAARTEEQDPYRAEDESHWLVALGSRLGSLAEMLLVIWDSSVP
jgi:hypothetical protein